MKPSNRDLSAGDAAFSIVGARTLLPSGRLEDACVRVRDGCIEEITSEEGVPDSERLDARGLLLLPGIVDLHGDAFEHLLMPRSGVYFSLEMALAEADRQLLANGITTAFHAVTWSWEPGLRGRDTAHALAAALDSPNSLGCDTRLHLRHELYNVEAENEILGWLRDGRISLLALNDHLSMISSRLNHAEKMSQYAERSGLTVARYKALVERVAAHAAEVPASVAQLCAAATEAGIPIASHDDETPEIRAHYRSLGAAICEFPCNENTARAAVTAGEAVVLGAPNVLRGGSHDSRMTAAAAIAEGLCDILTSDYYYPALAAAPFRLAENGDCDFAQAWNLVSAEPAHAAGLTDRGTIAPGLRADLIVIDDARPRVPRVTATLARGQTVYAAGKPSAPECHIHVKSTA